MEFALTLIGIEIHTDQLPENTMHSVGDLFNL